MYTAPLRPSLGADHTPTHTHTHPVLAVLGTRIHVAVPSMVPMPSRELGSCLSTPPVRATDEPQVAGPSANERAFGPVKKAN